MPLFNPRRNTDASPIGKQIVSQSDVASVRNFLNAAARPIEVPFHAGDASPKSIWDAPAQTTIFTVKLVIIESFAANALLEVGDEEIPDRFAKAIHSKPETIGIYETSPLYRYNEPTQVLLKINPNGSMQGSGLVILEVS